MLTYPDIDPVAFSVGPVQVHWYGLMYLVGIGIGWLLGQYRARREGSGWTEDEVNDLVFYAALGAVLGGRIGYVLFYDFAAYLEQPLRILKVWQGGMSFHGGLLGCILAMMIYGRGTRRGFFAVSDFIAPLVPIGLGAGRIGNFINGELWGKASDVPWAMMFPHAGGLPRHPSSLYQAVLEGAVLFAVLWWYSSRPRPVMAVSGMFLLCYGMFRIAVEFVREPDAHIGYLAFGWLTMGQVLTLPMMFFGLLFIYMAYRKTP